MKKLIASLLLAVASLSGEVYSQVKISQLPNATALTGVEKFECVQSATSKACTATQLATYTWLVSSGLGGLTVGGNLLFNPDGTYNIGAAGSGRPNNIYAAGNITAGSGFAFLFNGRTKLTSSADGILTIWNNAGSGLTRINLGGITASFPSLKVSGTKIQTRLADDSGYGSFDAANHFARSSTAAFYAPSDGGFRFSNTTDGGAGTSDTGLGRSAAGVVTTDTTAVGNNLGTHAAGVLLAGTATNGGGGEKLQVTGNAVASGGIAAGGSLTAGVNIQDAASGLIYWTGRSVLSSPADSKILLQNNAQTDFNLLQFGGVTSSFPAWKRSTNTLKARLADDSADAGITVGTLSVSSTASFTGAITAANSTFGGATVGTSGAGLNTILGTTAMPSATGVGNTAIGYFALNADTTGQHNTSVGLAAGASTTTGSDNTSIGWDAGTSNIVGANNTGVGSGALATNRGSNNTGLGYNALTASTSSSNNTAVGKDALLTNTTGTTNTAVGVSALSLNLTATDNTAVGYNALLSATGGVNTAVGSAAMSNVSTGVNNTAIGASAGQTTTTGSNNIFIGYVNQSLAVGDSNEIVIGTSVTGQGSNSTSIGNGSTTTAKIYGATTVDSLTTIVSSVISAANLGAAASSKIYWSGRGVMESPADGIIGLYNAAESGFTRLQFGGTTSSFPSIKRNSNAINFRLADDSADSSITAALGTFSAGISVTGTASATSFSGAGTSLTGTAASLTSGLATALAANGTNCSAGSYPLGVDASGNSESCTVAGTVTTVSVTTANGVSGTVANATTTPAITLSLAAITPTTVTASGAISGTSITGTSSVAAGAATNFLWTGRSVMSSPTDGSILLQNNAATGFTNLYFGGTTASFPKIKRNGSPDLQFNLADDSAYANIFAAQGTFAGQIATNNNIIATGSISAGTTVSGTTSVVGGTLISNGGATLAASGVFNWTGSSSLSSPSDGIITLQNTAATGFTRLQLGGTTSSFPSIKRSTTVTAFRLADDSADSPITASNGTFSGTLSATGHTTFEGVTSTGATGSGKLVYDNAATHTGTLTTAAISSSGAHAISDATDASSTSTGSINTAGGVGIAKKLYVGTAANILGTGNVILANGSTTGATYSKFSNTSGDLYLTLESSAGGSVHTGVGANEVSFGTAQAKAAYITTNNTARLKVDSAGLVYMPFLGSSSAATTGTLCWTTGTGLLNIDTTTTCLLSGAQYKKQDKLLTRGLDIVLAMLPKSYTLKEEYNPSGLGEQIGFFAQDVAKIEPRLVSYEPDGTPHAVRYQQYTAVLTKAIQELNNKLTAAQKQIDKLNKLINTKVRK